MYRRFQRLFEYERSSELAVLRAIAACPDHTHAEVQRAGDRAAHIVAAKREWMRRLEGSAGEPIELFPTGVSMDELETVGAQAAELWAEWLSHLTDARLRQVCDFSTTDGIAWSAHIEDILTHVINHSAYHRGQVATSIALAGGTPAVTDFIRFAAEPRATA
ncbi:MAG: DinB family protein [Planctomycetota bacterium]